MFNNSGISLDKPGLRYEPGALDGLKLVDFHVTGMGLSYILMLTAFYVDNGKNLPVCGELLILERNQQFRHRRAPVVSLRGFNFEVANRLASVEV